MSNRTAILTDALYDYMLDHGVKEPAIMRQLRAETKKLPTASMQIAPEQGQFLHFLTKLLGVQHALEIGTFTGYSALAVASALPEQGQLVACDINGEWTAIAQRFWHEAGVNHKIDLRLAPAIETLNTLVDEKALFDLIFIDADKINYLNYYQRCIKLLSPRGVLLVDNVFILGRAADPDNLIPKENRAAVAAIRAFNQYLKNATDIDLCILPIGDGLTMVRKKQD